jgi:hypothetical protein
MTAITRSEDHHYTYEGVTYPGVTGILKVLDKSDALMAWAARNTAEAAITLALDFETIGIPTPRGDVLSRQPSGLDKLLEAVGVDGTIKALTSRSSWKRDEAAALGTEVHNLADMVARGVPTPPMSDTVRSRVLKYTDWWKSSGWTLRTSEAMLVNPLAGYGGTLDLLARDADGRTVLADIKTGKAVYHEAVLQLTAYGDATLIEAPGLGLFPMVRVDRYVILHVTASEVRPVEVNVGALERAAFAGCLDMAEWRESVKGKRL